MNKTFHLSVRTPESEIISKEVNSIKVSTENGPMVVYPRHGSLSGSIEFSRLFIRTEHAETEYLIKNGVIFISVQENSTRIMCFSCQETKDIEYTSAAEYLQYVEERLKAGEDLNDFQLQFLQNEKIAMVKQLKVLKEREEK